MHFCKKLLGVKQSTQNDFIYGEVGRVNFAANRYISIVRYWLKIATLSENKHVKCIYNMLFTTFYTKDKRCFEQDWHARLENSTRAIFYSILLISNIRPI